MNSSDRPTCLLVHLAGSMRGTAVQVVGDELRIGTSPDAEIQLPDDLQPVPAPHHATLHRRGGSYTLKAVPGNQVWVNAEPVEEMVLASGDVIELGRDSAVLRFRSYAAGVRPSRTVGELFSDCLECATRGADTLTGRVAIAARQLPRDLVTQTSTAFRVVTVILVVAFAGSTLALARRTQDLETRLAAITDGVQVSSLLDRSEATDLDSESLLELIRSVEAELESTTVRLDSLQGQLANPARVIGHASRATIFLQGAYGFRDPKSGEDLRLVLGPDGRPIRGPTGEPALSLGGTGPPLESQYTGTGWVATNDGLIVTNRHVALPWEFDSAARDLIARGLEPVMRRFIGYLPGQPEAFAVTAVGASEEGDLAVLRCTVASDVPYLQLTEAPTVPGDEVIVLGYPLGIRALMVRAGTEFVEEIQRSGDTDFWSVASRLADRGLIAPLATRGIVGQRTDQYVTYDAETTSGGSGGPVIGRDGRVIAVNTAILPEFGGSNLGVPADLVAELLASLLQAPSPYPAARED